MGVEAPAPLGLRPDRADDATSRPRHEGGHAPPDGQGIGATVETAWPRADRCFRAMGTDGHVLVVGPGSEAMADAAVSRIAELEACWSRFLPTSEISQLNHRAGHPVTLSDDTYRLLDTAATARRLTGGRFDPTLGQELIALGYDRPFDEVLARSEPVTVTPVTVAPDAARPVTLDAIALDPITLDPITLDPVARTATIAPDRVFDPGGIGKGLAADVVVEELVDGGAWGALVNLGGDLRVAGVPPSGSTWVVAIDHPHRHPDRGPLTVVELVGGGLATSTTLRRRWPGPDGERHHLLDPRTGRPHRTGADFVTVVADRGWWAEVSATALVGSDLDTARAPRGCVALLAGPGGQTRRLGGFERFEQPPPDRTDEPDQHPRPATEDGR